jgi:transposase
MTLAKLWNSLTLFHPCKGTLDAHAVVPTAFLGDRAYDADAIRRGLRVRGIRPFLAERNTQHGSGLGKCRWVVERTFAWLNQFRRLRVRYEKRPNIHEAFLSLGCALICWYFLRATWGSLRSR